MKDSEEESSEIKPKTAAKKAAPKSDPMLAKITAKQKAEIESEMKRTGVDISTVLAPFKIKSLDEMTEAGYQTVMNRFSKTKDKK